jgi:transcriptional regulator with XRE-family HTH domain
MNEQIRQIADRIRGLRDIARLSVETCAQDLGIPAETYRRYESGEADMATRAWPSTSWTSAWSRS